MSEGIGGNGGVQLDENVTGVSGVEWHNLDYGASALVLTYLDSESLCRSEAVSKSFKESVGNAWTVLAIEKGLVEDVVVVPPGTWNFHTLSLCVASHAEHLGSDGGAHRTEVGDGGGEEGQHDG